MGRCEKRPSLFRELWLDMLPRGPYQMSGKVNEIVSHLLTKAYTCFFQTLSTCRECIHLKVHDEQPEESSQLNRPHRPSPRLVHRISGLLWHRPTFDHHPPITLIIVARAQTRAPMVPASGPFATQLPHASQSSLFAATSLHSETAVAASRPAMYVNGFAAVVGLVDRFERALSLTCTVVGVLAEGSVVK
jgi:hypothetical protein